MASANRPNAPKRARPGALTLVSEAQAEVITQPSVRALIHWTPYQLRTVSQLADNGDLWRLADLCDQILGDERFAEMLDKLASNIIGCDLTFEKDARSIVGSAQRSAELEEDWATGWGDDELVQFIIWRELLGASFGRHEHWMETDVGRIVPKFRTWHPKAFAFDHSATTPTWKVRKALPGGGSAPPVAIAKGDGEWVISTRRGDFRPWAQGLWRGLARWWMLKQYAISDWGVHSEKGSKLVLIAPEGVSGQDRKALAADMYALAKDATISLPAGFDLRLIETTANTRDIYLAQIDAADMAASIAILGQNLTSRVDGGSYAAAETHERGQNKRERYIARALGRTLWTQSIPWWAEYNFGDRKQAPYPRWQTDPPEDKGAKVQTLATLATAVNTLKQAGYRLSPERIEEEYGVELEELPEPVLPAPTGAVAPGGLGAPKPRPVQPVAAKPRAVPGKPAGAKLAYEPDESPDSGEPPRMVSGDAAPDAFVQGQQYADDLTTQSAEHAAADLSGFADRLIAGIDKATSHEELLAAVLKAYSDEPEPTRLAELCENAMVMAQLAGRHAAKTETD